MSLIDNEKLRAAAVMSDPFEYLVVPGLIQGDALKAVLRDFPVMDRAGSVPLAALNCGPAFRELVEMLRGPDVASLLPRHSRRN